MTDFDEFLNLVGTQVPKPPKWRASIIHENNCKCGVEVDPKCLRAQDAGFRMLYGGSLTHRYAETEIRHDYYSTVKLEDL
jgi:hypothetical protein